MEMLEQMKKEIIKELEESGKRVIPSYYNGGEKLIKLINKFDESQNIYKDKVEKINKRYSKEVAQEIAEGLVKITHANICISVTGEAENEQNICKCYYCIIINNKIYLEDVEFIGLRNEVRVFQTRHILKRIYDLLERI